MENSLQSVDIKHKSDGDDHLEVSAEAEEDGLVHIL